MLLNKSMRNFFLIYFVLSMITGCGRSDYIAKIDSEYITAEDINYRVSKLPVRYQEVIKTNKRKFLEELVIDNLLYQEAERRKLDKDKEALEVIEEAKKKILIAKLLQDEVDNAVGVSDEEISEYYAANTDEFKTPETFRASHIIVRTEEDAKKVIAELKNGADFNTLARRVSLDPSAVKGGDIGYFKKGQIDPDFENACSKLNVGEISGVVRTKFGFHVIKLTEIKKPSVEPFDGVRERIEQKLLALKRKRAFNALIARLRNNAKIIINEKQLNSLEIKEGHKENE